jgi:hypothetical protein
MFIHGSFFTLHYFNCLLIMEWSLTVLLQKRERERERESWKTKIVPAFKKLTNPAGINALLVFFLIRPVQWTTFTAAVIREPNACYSKLSSYSVHSNSPSFIPFSLDLNCWLVPTLCEKQTRNDIHTQTSYMYIPHRVVAHCHYSWMEVRMGKIVSRPSQCQ